MNTPNNPNNQPTNNQHKGDTMNDSNTQPRALWTRTDGTTTEGPADEMMRAYAAAGFSGTLQPIEPGRSQLDALTLPESTWDEDEVTEAGAPLRPLAVVKAEPAAEVGQREPEAVTVASLDALAERRRSGGAGFAAWGLSRRAHSSRRVRRSTRTALRSGKQNGKR